MPTPETAHERNRKFLETMTARAGAESGGEISAEALDAAHARNQAFRQGIQVLVDAANASGATQKRPKQLGG
jgi:hypothetical protein